MSYHGSKSNRELYQQSGLYFIKSYLYDTYHVLLVIELVSIIMVVWCCWSCWCCSYYYHYILVLIVTHSFTPSIVLFFLSYLFKSYIYVGLSVVQAVSSSVEFGCYILIKHVIFCLKLQLAMFALVVFQYSSILLYLSFSAQFSSV